MDCALVESFGEHLRESQREREREAKAKERKAEEPTALTHSVQLIHDEVPLPTASFDFSNLLLHASQTILSSSFYITHKYNTIYIWNVIFHITDMILEIHINYNFRIPCMIPYLSQISIHLCVLILSFHY